MILGRLFTYWRRRRDSRRRLIFPYAVGGVRRFADPIKVYRELEAAGTKNWHSLLILVSQLSKASEMPLSDEESSARAKRQFAAISTLSDIAMKAFDLRPLGDDGCGVTEEEAIGILADFIEFTEGLAEKARPFPS